MNIILRLFFSFFILISLLSTAIANDRSKNVKYRKQCLGIQKFLVKGKYAVSCNYNYHHYNSGAAKTYYRKTTARKAGNVAIAGFNVLHPGNKTRYKDYKYVAKIVNQWDVVAAVELLAILSNDLTNNNAVESLLKSGPKKVKALQAKIAKTTAAKSKKKLQDQLAKLKKDLKEAPSLYRAPGYLKLLNELRKLDPSWALLLSPRGEAAEETHVQELAGFYYRAKKVKPDANPYCEIIRVKGHGTPYGCIPNFSYNKKFMRKTLKKVFSRRPFLASFVSGNFDFALLASHIISKSPSDPDKMADILRPTFKVYDYKDLGVGINSTNYARFAEVRAILMFMKTFQSKFTEQDIMLVGDLNIESSNKFVSTLLSGYPSWSFLVDDPTSMSTTKFVKGNVPTNGFASNFDHFVLNRNVTDECKNKSGDYDPKVFNFYKGSIASAVNRKYRVRSKSKSGGIYPISYSKMEKVDKAVETYRKKAYKLKTIKNGKIVADTKNVDKHAEEFREGVYLSQQYDKTYYLMYLKLLSDHMPIYMNCRNNMRDDD